MIQVNYICDKCKTSQLTSEQFWTIGVVAKHNTNKLSSNDHFMEPLSIQVCRPCLDSFGVHVQKKKNEPQPEARTTEDILRELIERAAP